MIGADGNVSADALYTDVSSASAGAWDLHLQPGSPAIDAGDPALADDASAADMGACGRPDGSSW